MTKKVSNPRVLVVDDESSMHEMLGDFLLAQGYEVVCFASAPAALSELRRRPEAFTAILSDIRMHPMDGIDFLRIVKRDFPTMPVLLFTGAATPEEKMRVLQLGAACYLAKPFSLMALKKLLDEMSGISGASTVGSV